MLGEMNINSTAIACTVVNVKYLFTEFCKKIDTLFYGNGLTLALFNNFNKVI